MYTWWCAGSSVVRVVVVARGVVSGSGGGVGGAGVIGLSTSISLAVKPLMASVEERPEY